jgi:hypothetical protein
MLLFYIAAFTHFEHFEILILHTLSLSLLASLLLLHIRRLHQSSTLLLFCNIFVISSNACIPTNSNHIPKYPNLFFLFFFSFYISNYHSNRTAFNFGLHLPIYKHENNLVDDISICIIISNRLGTLVILQV